MKFVFNQMKTYDSIIKFPNSARQYRSPANLCGYRCRIFGQENFVPAPQIILTMFTPMALVATSYPIRFFML